MPHRRQPEVAGLGRPISLLASINTAKVRLDELHRRAQGSRGGDVTDNVESPVGWEVPLLPEAVQLLAIPRLDLQASVA